VPISVERKRGADNRTRFEAARAQARGFTGDLPHIAAPSGSWPCVPHRGLIKCLSPRTCEPRPVEVSDHFPRYHFEFALYIES